MALTVKHLPLFDSFRYSEVHDHVCLSLSFLSLIFIFLYHTRKQVPIYHRKFHKRKLYLYVHILTGLAEAFRYRFRVFHGHSNILPDALDILATFIWSWTSLELVKTLRRGDPLTTRPAYQAGACLRPVATLISYICGISSLYTVSIRALDGFLYARFAIFYFVSTPYLKGYSDSQIYAISIPLAGVLSIWQSQVHSATLIYILATAYIAKLNEWVTRQSQLIRESGTSKKHSQYFIIVIETLVSLGFVELKELKAVVMIIELEESVEDEYVSGEYSKM